MSFTDKIVSEFTEAERNMNGEKESALFQVRKDALNSFLKFGIPGNRHEEWRYTHIKTQLPESLSVSANQSLSLQKNQFNSFDKINASKIVFVNGNFSKELSSIIEESGVTVGSLREHSRINRSLTETYYGKLVKKYEEHFSVLNTAFATDGAFVHVKKGTISKTPVFIIYLFDSPENFTQSRTLVIAEEGSELNLVLDFQNTGAISFYNHVSEIYVGKGANVNVTHLQVETANSTAVHTMEAEVQRDAKFACTTVTFEGKLIRNTSNVRLSGENVEAHLIGLYHSRGNSLIDNHILVDHIVPNCQSNQLYKGIVDDEAAGVFNGKIFVKPNAQKTNAYQSSKAILLSESARVDSKPQLEIFADDVKCSHGAAIGQLNEDEIFYLRARGIHEQDAKSLLTYAFANQIIESIVIVELKEYLYAKLKERLKLNF